MPSKNKTIILMVAVFFSMTLVSAIAVYSGEPVEIELEKPFDYYSIVGNHSNVILDIQQNGNNVTITPDKYSQNDSYEIIFFDKEKETITIHTSSGGGGSSRTKWKTEYVNKNITTYVTQDVEKIVQGKDVEVEKIVNKTHWFAWVLIISLIGMTAYLFFNRTERGLEKDNE